MIKSRAHCYEVESVHVVLAVSRAERRDARRLAVRRTLLYAALMLGAAALIVGIVGRAHAIEMYSFTWGAWGMPASYNGDQIVSIPSCHGFQCIPGRVGAGVMPATSFTIVGTETCNEGGATDSTWSVIGKTAPNGDYISPYKIGPGCQAIMYPAGYGFVFNPGDELHLHTQSATPHDVRATIYYTVP